MCRQAGVERQDCCVAVMAGLNSAGRACLEVHLGALSGLAVSMLSRPGGAAHNRELLRIRGVGTVVCRGHIARHLRGGDLAGQRGPVAMSELPGLTAIPVHHARIYGEALKSGQVIMVLQGESMALRQGCSIVEKIAVKKPVLYLA